MEVTNFDGMSISELWGWLDTHPKAHVQQRHYVQHKIFAMEYRLQGCIEDAVRHEKECDKRYAKLPKKLRW